MMMLLCPGDLKAEAVQRFETYDDLQKHQVTVEEREEYEQHLRVGTIVYAGVDYKAILRQVGGQHRHRSESELMNGWNRMACTAILSMHF